MVWSSHRLRWGYVCSNCGSNRDTGKRVIVLNAPPELSALSPLHDRSSPCSGAEYTSLKQELLERNSQRDNLLFKIKDLTENNRKYKDHLECQDSGRRPQVSFLHKVQATQLADRDHLIASLQSVVEEHEKTIQQLELRIDGKARHIGDPRESAATFSQALPTSSAFNSSTSSAFDSPTSSAFNSPTSASNTQKVSDVPSTSSSTPSSSSTLSRLLADIKCLQDEKAQLGLQLAEAQDEANTCKLEYVHKIAELQKTIACSKRNKENSPQHILARDGNTSTCSTDTEKQLEKVQAENLRLTSEISSLHRFYTRNPTAGYSLQSEQIRRLQDELEEARIELCTAQAALERKEQEEQEHEGELRTEITLALVEKQRAERQLELLRNRVTSLKEHNVSWQETEQTLRAEISGVNTEKRQTAQQLRDLQAKWTALQAKDPDVITKIVQVEVESEDLKTQVGLLNQRIAEWEKHCVDRDRTVASMSQQLQKAQEESRMLHDCLLEEVEKERASKELAINDVRRQLEGKIFDLQVANQQLLVKQSHIMSAMESIRQAHGVLVREARQFPNTIAVVVTETSNKITKALQCLADENKDLVQKYHKEMRLRKKYHNELVELKGNIRVFCRVRPKIKEDGSGTQTEIAVTYDPDDDGIIYITNKGRIQTFEFDKVFSDNSTQTQVFEEVRSLVTCCIDGYNVCIFAYGQTGSGKTFTMEGHTNDPGINPRALQELFSEIADRGSDWQFSLQVSVMEIYNETIRDLLSMDNGNKLDVKMKAEGKGYHVPGLVTETVTCLADVNRVFAEGRKNRATAVTNMNEHSSRSHCLLCVTVTGSNKLTGSRSLGRLNLVDLAGSERVSKSGADGDRLKEAQNINRSLSCLGDVIHALRVKQSHIPYRNSKLTYLLQESLGGDSKTLMIVQAAPVEKNVSETTCSLSFGQRVRMVELGTASRKLETSDTEPKMPTSPTGSVGTASPPPKRKAATATASNSSTPKSPGLQSQLRLTPSKSSPALRVTRQTSKK